MPTICSEFWFSHSFTGFLPHVHKGKRCHSSQTWFIPSLFLCSHLQHQLLNSSFQSLVKISNNLDKCQCFLLISPHLLAHQSWCSLMHLSSLCSCFFLWFPATVSAFCSQTCLSFPTPADSQAPHFSLCHLWLGCFALHSCYLLCFHTTVAVTTASIWGALKCATQVE